jgi:hypothetical protein
MSWNLVFALFIVSMQCFSTDGAVDVTESFLRGESEGCERAWSLAGELLLKKNYSQAIAVMEAYLLRCPELDDIQRMTLSDTYVAVGNESLALHQLGLMKNHSFYVYWRAFHSLSYLRHWRDCLRSLKTVQRLHLPRLFVEFKVSLATTLLRLGNPTGLRWLAAAQGEPPPPPLSFPTHLGDPHCLQLHPSFAALPPTPTPAALAAMQDWIARVQFGANCRAGKFFLMDIGSKFFGGLGSFVHSVAAALVYAVVSGRALVMRARGEWWLADEARCANKSFGCYFGDISNCRDFEIVGRLFLSRNPPPPATTS